MDMRLAKRTGSRREVGFVLYAVTDRKLLGEEALEDRIEALCRKGLRGIMIREKDLDEEALYALTVRCRPVFEKYGADWFINGSVAVARRSGATGVHLTDGQEVPAARGVLGENALIGKSVHGLPEAVAAAEAGADLLTFGPVYATLSKARYGPPHGLARLREVCAAVRVPVFAIGGVTPERVCECREAGACGVAAISAFMAREGAEEAVARYERHFQRN